MRKPADQEDETAFKDKKATASIIKEAINLSQ
jgi:hypothetical protein